MGGKFYGFDRMNADGYRERVVEVRAVLDRYVPGQYAIPRSYGAKLTFGDIDVLVVDQGDQWPAMRTSIADELRVNACLRNGNTDSMSYRQMQLDFFQVEPEYLRVMAAFMDFNDLGNLVGRLARKFGLKWGERGLTYPYRRASGNYVVDMPVSLDFEAVCRFLGLDYATWRTGFHELHEMFDWVIASPYFSVGPYVDSNESTSHMRKDGVHRTNIARFIDYLSEKDIIKRYEYAERELYLPMILAAFPDAKLVEQIAMERIAEARADMLRAKFGGKLVQRLRPEFKDHAAGPALGEFIRTLKASMPDFETWLLSASSDEIEQRIVGHVVPAKE